MRKLLLASAAAIGATTGMLGVALAQSPWPRRRPRRFWRRRN